MTTNGIVQKIWNFFVARYEMRELAAGNTQNKL